ncbi:MAG: putative alpha/beta hydrolase family esterase [Candidatus Azotimanducaceae bacterium]|jgi:predicted alpha/beta hydrolase family esterase
MKKQILIIHGGRAYSTHDAFLDKLQTRVIDNPFQSRFFKWKDTLSAELGEGYEVCFPEMPNKEYAKYKEWKIWLERHLEFLRDDVTLIGHSLGGYFLAKYLSENNMSVAIGSLYLVAAVYESDNFEGEDGGDFNFDPKNLPQIAEKVENIHILHSKDDPVVPYEHALKFKEALPRAELMTFEDKGHFNMEEFPELVGMVRG